MAQCDYLALRSENSPHFLKISELLRVNKEPGVGLFFSDYMTRFDRNFNRNKKIIFLSQRTLYGLSKKSCAVEFKYPLEYIAKITLVLNSPSLIVLQLKGQEIS